MTPDPAALEDLARNALETGEEEAALDMLERAAVEHGSARLWQWVGLLQRSLDRHEAAIDAFARAARLAPGDAGIAHGHAHVTLEAGLPAVSLHTSSTARCSASAWLAASSSAAPKLARWAQTAVDGAWQPVAMVQ